jgi:phosphoglycolate phosphatase
MTHLYIFDIDGTLLSAGSGGTRAINQVFVNHFGYENMCQHLNFAGATDKNIFAQAQRIASLASGKPIVHESILFEAYAKLFEKDIGRNNTCVAYKGVISLLDRLKDNPGLVLGIGTGNLKSTAQLKLKYSGLDSYFSFGGYGSDCEARPEIFKKALARGTERLGQKLSRVVVFGDTPKDIWAARAIGAEVVAVTTGTFDADELAQENPDLVVDDLDIPELIAWLGAP